MNFIFKEQHELPTSLLNVLKMLLYYICDWNIQSLCLSNLKISGSTFYVKHVLWIQVFHFINVEYKKKIKMTRRYFKFSRKFNQRIWNPMISHISYRSYITPGCFDDNIYYNFNFHVSGSQRSYFLKLSYPLFC